MKEQEDSITYKPVSIVANDGEDNRFHITAERLCVEEIFGSNTVKAYTNGTWIK